MKPSWGFILSSLYFAASAASASTLGRVYVWDSTRKSADKQLPSSVSPETARLIFAQRLGLSQFHDLKSVDEDVIQQLSQYGGRPQRLFSGARESNDAHAIVVIEGVENAEELVSISSSYSEFSIINPPPVSSNARLLEDFMLQADSLPEVSDPLLTSYNSDLIIGEELRVLGQPNSISTHNHITFLHIESLETIAKSYGQAASLLRTAFQALLQQAERLGFSVTIVMMPPSASTNTKRSVSPYGAYSIPNRAQNQPRRQNPEAILSSPAVPEASSNVNFSTAQDTTSPQVYAKSVLGILPPCFESLSICQISTYNCSGHGQCRLARKGEQRAGGEGKYNDCYSCACKPTIVKNGDGTVKTARYGGPACQKKDVVVPFWLFAGSTVVLVFLISSAIGMLYSMGSEELPSVIGAGVSGPVRK
ncbi:hypothetical protein AOQ84DRAFT_382746 [Glonium stellatum]|uniref:DUF3844 domain-containing protein n=1 Tax=Glonium stellatum TaxID=574774 RepID=A0A8E2EP80_9PEZI|nr:hypothetical protein AOQ84DRAFT_382746 [Glonium stellatum]